MYGAAQLGLFDTSEIHGGLTGGNAPNGGGASDTTGTYMFYTGPVFPLTASGDTEGVTAQRSTDYDFSPYRTVTKSYEENGETVSYESYESKSIVTDGYVLTNSTGSDKTVTAIYPFAASFDDRADAMPQITIDGTAAQTRLFAGPYTGGFEGALGDEDIESGSLNLSEISSWEGYKSLIESGYANRAFDQWPQLNQPVTVYRLGNYTYSANTEAPSPTINMSFSIDRDKTTVLTWNMDGGVETDYGYCSRSVGSIQICPDLAPENREPDDAYLVLLGEDISGYELQGYANGACEPGDELYDLSAEVTRYETTLGEFFKMIAEKYSAVAERQLCEGEEIILSHIPDGMFPGAAAELICDWGPLSESCTERYEYGMLEDIFKETCGMKRVMYLTFDVTVPAGESVCVSASMAKKASIYQFDDSSEEDHSCDGYDMVTRLGSSLEFTSQRASLSGEENIRILSQNFGFDLENSVSEVELDMTQEHYYIEVCKRV